MMKEIRDYRVEPRDPLWLITVDYPAVMAELSKNRMNVVMKRGQGPNARGQIVKSRQYLQAKAKLAAQITGALVQEKRRQLMPEDELMIQERRLWIAIHLEKRQATIDAANVVDIVCDAVQDATGLNDSWYSLGCVDWSINPHEPVMRLTIWQEQQP